MAIRQHTDDLIEFLNALLDVDRAWLSELMDLRPRCSEAMACHPTVQVVSGASGASYAGLFGLLNGFCGTIDHGPHEGYGPITACYAEDGVTIEKFVRTEDIKNPRTKECDG